MRRASRCSKTDMGNPGVDRDASTILNGGQAASQRQHSGSKNAQSIVIMVLVEDLDSLWAILS